MECNPMQWLIKTSIPIVYEVQVDYATLNYAGAVYGKGGFSISVV